ncbi:hypothetical protein [Limisalsivibrio acetivorans]|uniref:hypothetical protein n=1 Tax=Limisalsivibrio acetivorans TaxID=1304888 RepID=UPI0003B5B35E|nr:hypothetical protein [Limisalsivibrio acetivorans]
MQLFIVGVIVALAAFGFFFMTLKKGKTGSCGCGGTSCSEGSHDDEGSCACDPDKTGGCCAEEYIDEKYNEHDEDKRG